MLKSILSRRIPATHCVGLSLLAVILTTALSAALPIGIAHAEDGSREQYGRPADAATTADAGALRGSENSTR